MIQKLYKIIQATSIILAATFTVGYAQNIDKNIIENGPLTICSHSWNYDSAKNEIVYSGNVLAIQIKKAVIACNKKLPPIQNENNYPKFFFSEHPENKTYAQQQLHSLNIAKDICKKQKGCRFFSGQKIVVKFDSNNKKVKTLNLSSFDNNSTVYYSYPYMQNNKTTSNNGAIEAYAKTMNYNIDSNLLTLVGSVAIKRNNNNFTAHKALYNTKTKELKIPISNERSTVVIGNLPE